MDDHDRSSNSWSSLVEHKVRSEKEPLVPQDGIESISEEGIFTVSQAISEIGCGRQQLELFFICGICWAADSFEMMLLSFLLPALKEEWELDEFSTASIASVAFFGMFLGAPFFGILSDHLGRRIGFFVATASTAFFGVMSAFSTTLTVLLVCRLFVGIGVGGAHVALSLFSEFLPMEKRGISLISIDAFWSGGAVIEAALAWIILPTLGWRWLLIVSSLPEFFLLIFVYMVPESPRYLLEKGKDAQALSVLQIASKKNHRSLPKGKLTGTASPVQYGNRFLLLELFQPTIIRTTFMLWIIWFIDAFAYYGVVIMTPAYFQAKDTSEDLVEGVFLSTFITSIAEFPGLAICAAMVDRLGRKKTQSYAFALCSVALFMLIIDFPFAILVMFAIFARMSIAGTFATIYVYTPEVYPTPIRSTGVGMCVAFARVGAILAPYIVELFTDSEIWVPICFFAASCFCASIISLLMPQETSKIDLDSK